MFANHLSLLLTLTCATTLINIRSAEGGTIVFVNADAPDGGDGTTWKTAFNDLQDGLVAATSGTQIWVADGIYTPTGANGDRAVSFQMADGVELYGGFAGTENTLEERDISANPTILSGDLNGDDGPDFANNGENSYHVVFAMEVGERATLDGFTVAGGNANETSPSIHRAGGGLHAVASDFAIANCRLLRNRAISAGAVFLSTGALDISACAFEENRSDIFAGALYAAGSVHVTQTTFHANQNLDERGGAVALFTTAHFDQCIFVQNSSEWAGALSVESLVADESVTLERCTFEQNHATFRGGAVLHFQRGLVSIRHCRFLSNTANLSGGALSTELWAAQEGRTEVFGCEFVGNSGLVAGGAIYTGFNSGSLEPLRVESSTMTANSAGISGGIYADDSLAAMHIEMSNSILWNNSDSSRSGSTSDLHSDGATINVSYSCVQHLAPQFNDIGNLTNDPLFVDADGPDDIPGTEDDDLHLLRGSPCVNAGDPESDPIISVDIDGEPRIQQCRIDMGVDETPFFIDDCNDNGIADTCEIQSGSEDDCNLNGIPDTCDIASGKFADVDGDLILDECECFADCAGPFGSVDIDDLFAVIEEWGPGAAGSPCDFFPYPGGNNVVNIDEIFAVIAAWGPCPQ